MKSKEQKKNQPPESQRKSGSNRSSRVRRSLSVGDYVIVGKYSDYAKEDPWEIGFLQEISILENGLIYYRVDKRFYKCCKRISKERGAKIIKERYKWEEAMGFRRSNFA